MAANSSTVTISLKLNDKGVVTGMRQVGKESDKVEDSLKSAGNSGSRSLSQIDTAAGKASKSLGMVEKTIAAVGAAFAAAKLIEYTQQIIDATLRVEAMDEWYAAEYKKIYEKRNKAAEDALDDFFDEIDALEEKQRKHTDVVADLWKNMAQNIQNDFADTIYSMLDGNLDSFGDFFDSILDMFKRMVAEMAAYDLASVIFGGDAVGEGVGLFTGGSGGSGILGSIGSLGSVTGVLDSIGLGGGAIGGIVEGIAAVTPWAAIGAIAIPMILDAFESDPVPFMRVQATSTSKELSDPSYNWGPGEGASSKYDYNITFQDIGNEAREDLHAAITGMIDTQLSMIEKALNVSVNEAIVDSQTGYGEGFFSKIELESYGDNIEQALADMSNELFLGIRDALTDQIGVDSGVFDDQFFADIAVQGEAAADTWLRFGQTIQDTDGILDMITDRTAEFGETAAEAFIGATNALTGVTAATTSMAASLSASMPGSGGVYTGYVSPYPADYDPYGFAKTEEDAVDAEKIKSEWTKLNIELMELEGDAAEALRWSREIEISVMDESLVPLQQRIWALEDQKEADEAAAEAAENAAEKAEKLAEDQERAAASLASIVEVFDSIIGPSVSGEYLSSLHALNEKYIDYRDQLSDLGQLYDENGNFTEAAQKGLKAFNIEISNLYKGLSDSIGLARAMAGGFSSQDFQKQQLMDKYGFTSDQQMMENLAAIAQMGTTDFFKMAMLLEMPIDELLQDIQTAAQFQQDLISEIESAISEIESFVNSVKDTIQSIKYSDLNVSVAAVKADAATEDYDALMSRAMSEGATIDDRIAAASFASTFLEQSQAANKSSETYQADYARVMSDLQALADSGAMSYEQEQTRLLNEMVNGSGMNMTVNMEGLGENDIALLTGILDIVESEGWDADFLIDFITNFDSWDQVSWNTAIETTMMMIEQFGPDGEVPLTLVASLDITNWTDEQVLDTLKGAVDLYGGTHVLTLTLTTNVGGQLSFPQLEKVLGDVALESIHANIVTGYVESASSFTSEELDLLLGFSGLSPSIQAYIKGWYENGTISLDDFKSIYGSDGISTSFAADVVGSYESGDITSDGILALLESNGLSPDFAATVFGYYSEGSISRENLIDLLDSDGLSSEFAAVVVGAYDDGVISYENLVDIMNSNGIDPVFTATAIGFYDGGAISYENLVDIMDSDGLDPSFSLTVLGAYDDSIISRQDLENLLESNGISASASATVTGWYTSGSITKDDMIDIMNSGGLSSNFMSYVTGQYQAGNISQSDFMSLLEGTGVPTSVINTIRGEIESSVSANITAQVQMYPVTIEKFGGIDAGTWTVGLTAALYSGTTPYLYYIKGYLSKIESNTAGTAGGSSVSITSIGSFSGDTFNSTLTQGLFYGTTPWLNKIYYAVNGVESYLSTANSYLSSIKSNTSSSGGTSVDFPSSMRISSGEVDVDNFSTMISKLESSDFTRDLADALFDGSTSRLYQIAYNTAKTLEEFGKTGKYATGGIAFGPTSGYLATLHGTEAVVPLPDGKTIPVQISDRSNRDSSANDRPIHVTVMVGNDEFDAYIDQRADNVRVKAERRGGRMMARRAVA